MAGFLHDFRYALRQLRRSPWFAAAATLMLALGICAAGTALSWIEGTMLRPVPAARDTRHLVSIMRGTWNVSPGPPFSYPDYRDLRDANRTFSGILGYHHDWATLTGGDSPQRIYAAQVTANYFDVLGIKPLLGRFFRPDEEARLGGVPYVVLGYSLWKTRFQSDPAILGKSIEIQHQPFTIIGVAPPDFIGCMPAIREDLWAPLAPGTTPGSNDWRILHREDSWLNVVGRLRPGVSREAATQDLETNMRRLVAAYPSAHLGANTITLDPMWRSPFGGNGYFAASLPVLLAFAALVLLLTCANVATLMLVRFVARARDLAIRQSLGAGRVALMRQMILEGLIVSLAGSAIALLLTVWTSKMLGRFLPPNAIPVVVSGALDQGVVLALLLVTLGAGVLCGALPAWRSSHIAPAEVLRQESLNLSSGSHNRHVLSGLVVAQVALSLALLVCAGLFLRTLHNTATANPGFDGTHVLTATIGLDTGYSGDEIRQFQKKILARARELPGLTAVSLTDWLPLSLSRKSSDVWPEGYVPQPHESGEVTRADVSAGYFATLGIPIVEGRPFTDADDANALSVMIVDQTAAARYWPGKDALGRRLRMLDTLYTVVGVAKNSTHLRLGETPQPMVYNSILQQGGPETILQVRTPGDPAAAAPALVEAIHQIDPQWLVYDVRPLRQTTQIASTFAIMESTFATAFALLALVLAASGIYGVLAYRAQLRTHEIGIRMALGAARQDVLWLILRQGLRLASLGIAFGLVLTLALTRFIGAQLYGVSPADPLTLIAVTLLLAVVAGAASSLPALRAMRIDPMAAIHES
ncbi:MAG TPA: ABC transporter permease [Acidobacteriaceae bacterium]|jgi:predicted permease|nr:ABC transporter permease [Acidobacteriaceae bacterium]